MVPLEEMDFTTGLRVFDELEAIDAKRFKPETKLQKVVGILF